MMSQAQVFAIILNTNRRDDTLACLASLSKTTYQHLGIVVLDNASSDGSVAAINSVYPAVHVVELSENRGYAGNNNVGIQAALDLGADWVWILNEDTVVAPDCLERLLAVGAGRSDIGILGPLVYHHDEPTVIQSAGGRLDGQWQSNHIGQNEQDTGQFTRPMQVDWVSGCALLVRRAVIDQIGPFDERFFYYWEETEWCLRTRRRGWRIMSVPAAKLWHKGVQRDYSPGPSVTYYNTRNRFLMLAKHNAPPHVWMAAWSQVLRTLASWSLKPRWRSMRDHRDAMWQGTVDFLRHRWGMRSV